MSKHVMQRCTTAKWKALHWLWGIECWWPTMVREGKGSLLTSGSLYTVPCCFCEVWGQCVQNKGCWQRVMHMNLLLQVDFWLWMKLLLPSPTQMIRMWHVGVVEALWRGSLVLYLVLVILLRSSWSNSVVSCRSVRFKLSSKCKPRTIRCFWHGEEFLSRRWTRRTAGVLVQSWSGNRSGLELYVYTGSVFLPSFVLCAFCFS